MAESGLAGFDVRIATVLMAPRGTPEEAIKEWNALARGVLADPATAPRFADWGVQAEDGAAAAQGHGSAPGASAGARSGAPRTYGAFRRPELRKAPAVPAEAFPL